MELLAINEIQKDLTSPGYTEPLTVEFLKGSYNSDDRYGTFFIIIHPDSYL